MNNHFFDNPILNSPYKYPSRHWELDGDGQPTRKIIERRRRAEFISAFPSAEPMIHAFMRAPFSGPDAGAEFDQSCAFVRRVPGL